MIGYAHAAITKMMKFTRILKYHLAKIIFGSFLVVLICGGCQTQLIHPTILESPICEPPCWENITPDLTTKIDVIKILTSLPIVDKPITERDDDIPKGADSVIMFYLYGEEQFGGLIYFVDNIVSLIDFRINGLSLQQAIDEVGTPELVYVYKGGEYTGVTFLLPEAGITFSYTTWAQSQDKRDIWGEPLPWLYLEIKPTVEINWITYFAPDQYQTLLDLGELTIGDSLSPEDQSSRLFLWDGFGSIDKYWRPINP
jgi:hypothetical protein